MKQLLFTVVVSSVLCGVAWAQIAPVEQMPIDPIEQPSEPLVWTYAETWWENATPDPTNNCNSENFDPSESPFTTCANGRFRLVVRQAAEFNPAANAHGVQQTVQILDQSDQIVSQESANSFYTDTHRPFLLSKRLMKLMLLRMVRGWGLFRKELYLMRGAQAPILLPEEERSDGTDLRF